MDPEWNGKVYDESKFKKQTRELINPFSVGIKYRMSNSLVVMTEIMGQFRYRRDAESYKTKLIDMHPWNDWFWYDGDDKETCEFIEVVIQ